MYAIRSYYETGGHRLVIDPFFTGNPAASTTADNVSPDFRNNFV